MAGALNAVIATLVSTVVTPSLVPKWNPSTKGTDITLSNNDQTATSVNGSGVYYNVLSVNNSATLKLYFEVMINRVIVPAVGWAQSGQVLNNSVPGNDTNAVAYFSNTGNVRYNNTTLATQATFTTGDIIMCAADTAGGKFWFGKNGTFTGSPAAGTGGYSGFVNNAFALASVYFSDDAVTLTSSNQLAYPIPSGFVALT